MGAKMLKHVLIIILTLISSVCLGDEITSRGIGPISLDIQATTDNHITINKQEISLLLNGDCSDYYDLTGFALPITWTGTTIDATNDYGPFPSRPSCWQGDYDSASGAAGDVTFKWTAPETEYYNFYVISTTFDPAIELYLYTCPVEPQYPVDFICGNDNYSMLQPKLSHISCTQDQEVFIVIDGNGTSEGDFTFIITYENENEPLICPPNTIYGQPGPIAGQDYYLITSDLYQSNWRAYDNIPDDIGQVWGVSFWGCDSRYSGGRWIECDEDDMVFDVAFWTNGIDNKPYQLINNFTISPARTATWAYITVNPHVFGTVYHYQAIFDEPMPVDGGWVSIQGVSQQSPTDCNFIWLAAVIPGDSCLSYSNGQWVNWDGGALSFCLLDSTASNIYENEAELPAQISLQQNYPNPFNAKTTIDFSLPEASPVTLDIYDILGRKLERLVTGYLEPGIHRALWNGDKYSSGIYLYKLNAGGQTEVKKMQLIK